MRHGISTSCPDFEPSESPAAQTALGCLCILVGIVGQLELFAELSRRQWIPIVFSRKMAHIGSGSLMTSALVLFPRQYWPARLAVSLFLVSFMLVFATIAHLPDDRFAALPPLLRGRLEAMVQSMCRTGERVVERITSRLLPTHGYCLPTATAYSRLQPPPLCVTACTSCGPAATAPTLPRLQASVPS